MASNNRTCFVFDKDDSTKILIQIVYEIPSTNISRQFNLLRSIDESVSQTIHRLTTNIERAIIKEIDLINLDYKITAAHPSWVNACIGKYWMRTWKGRWTNEYLSITNHHELLLTNKSSVSLSTPNAMNNGKVQLKDMLDWADQTLELARFWKNLVIQRYHYESEIFNYNTN
ncbi:unnamed protein product [Rotaria sp. Silwood2]|nr:unnamed protein product [Rotaria sp. Silwood2]